MFVSKIAYDKYMEEPLSQFNIEDVPQESEPAADFGDIDFESFGKPSEIDFESDKPTISELSKEDSIPPDRDKRRQRIQSLSIDLKGMSKDINRAVLLPKSIGFSANRLTKLKTEIDGIESQAIESRLSQDIHKKYVSMVNDYNEGIKEHNLLISEHTALTQSKIDKYNEKVKELDYLQSIGDPIPEPEDIYEGLIKPTAKALVKVPASIIASMALLPGAGIASLIELLPSISTDPDKLIEFGTLDDAMKTYKQVMSIPGKLITTPAEQKAVENISLVMKPIEMAGEGWREIGKAINSGLVQLGLEPTYLEPLLATYGEACAVFALPGVIRKLKNSTSYRMMTIQERGLVVQSLAETMSKNPSMTEGQLLRTYDNPLWRAEALTKRSIKANYVDLKKYAEVKSREAKIESAVKIKKEEPPKPQGVARPEDVTPSHTFTSKKGNYYYKVDGEWYDNKGKEVINRFIIKAAEDRKVSFDGEKAKAEDIKTIKDIEERYGKDIEQVSDKEVEEFFVEREEGIVEKRKVTTIKAYRGEFKPAGVQIPTDYGYWGKGKYYSLEKKVAQRYAKGADIQEVSIDISNFAKMSVSKANSIKSEIAKNNPDLTTEEVAEQFGINLRKEGYDGFILEGKDREIVVYPKKVISEVKPKGETEIDWFGEGEPEPKVGEAAETALRKSEPTDLYERFREDPEITKRNLEMLPEYSKIDTPEVLLTRISSEINSWVDGEKVDIDVTLDLLDKLAEQSKLWVDGTERPTGIFEDMGLAESQNFSEYLEELNNWAKSVEPLRSIKKQRGGVELSPNRLNMMIPLDEVPKVVKNIYKGIKNVKFGKLFRNKEVFDKTGFWLGKDGKWRYEIDDSKTKYYEYKTGFEMAFSDKIDKKLSDLLDHKELYKNFPELQNLKVILNKDAKTSYYLPDSNLIVLSEPSKKTLFHELQHAVNEKMKAFSGISEVDIELKIIKERLEYLRDNTTLPEIKEKVIDALKTELHKDDIDWYWKQVVPFIEKYDSPKVSRELKFPYETKETYFRAPGEMEARLVEERIKMSAEERKKVPPWATLDRMLLTEELPRGVSTQLYTGIPLDKIIDKLTSRIKKKVPEKPPEPFPKVKEEAMEIVRERRGNLNLANYETNKFINSIEQKTTPKQREVFIFALEKTNVPKEFNRPDLQKVLDKHRKHIETISKEIKIWFDEGWKKIKYHIPDLSVKQIEDYVTHLWDIPKHKKAEAAAWFSTQNRLLERRFIPTYAEGIKRGYKPKTLDILEIIKTHDSICNRAIENTKYIKRLMAMKRDGIPLMQRSKDAPLDWIEVDYPAITRRISLPVKEVARKGEFVKEIKVRVHPDLVRPLKAIFEERFDHPVVSAYEAINGIMKKSMLSLSLFHHGALGETGIALIGFPKTFNIYFNPVKIYKGLVRGELDIFVKEKIAKDSALHGVQYGATADIPVAKIQRYLNDLAEMSTNVPLVNRITKLLKNFNSMWDKALWSYLHDTLKLYGYESLVGKLDPKLNAEATLMAKREIAQFINDTFGGQNWDALMITPKEVQMLTWSLLSADWTVSTTRQALALTGIGRVYKETAGLRRKMARIYWLRAALFFGVGMNMLNAMFRERDMKENPQYYEDRKYSYFDKTMFENTIGKKTNLFKGRYNDGSERYIRWGKQFRDFFELLITPFRKLGGKMAPVPQLMSEIFAGHTLSGFKNDDIYGTKGLEKAKGIFKTIVKAPLPISVKRAMKENMEFKALDIVMQSSKGMSRYTAMEYFKKAVIEGDEDLLSDTYIGTLRNNLPAFTLFNAALSWVEAEIVTDIAKDVEDIEDARSKLNAAESAYDKKRYGRILKRLERERVDKEAGLILFRVAIVKARSYRELGLGEKTPRLPAGRGQSSQGSGLGEIRFE